MSAAANAAGYLYVHGRVPASDTGTRGSGAHGAAQKAAERPAPAQPQAAKPPRTPKIEYRKRRLYLVPSSPT